MLKSRHIAIAIMTPDVARTVGMLCTAEPQEYPGKEMSNSDIRLAGAVHILTDG
jgi:hypothetical protein